MSIDEDEGRAEEAWLDSFEEYFPEALYERSAEVAHVYLRSYGDEIQDRVYTSIDLAAKHLSAGHSSSAVVSAFTAIELIIGYLLFRPLSRGVGALWSEELADRLVDEFFEGKAKTQRIWLPAVLPHWDIDLDGLKLSNGDGLWAAVVGAIRKSRNAVLHQGASATADDAALALEAAELLMDEVVFPLAKRLGFTSEVTGKWCEIGHVLAYARVFKASSPFKE